MQTTRKHGVKEVIVEVVKLQLQKPIDKENVQKQN